MPAEKVVDGIARDGHSANVVDLQADEGAQDEVRRRTAPKLGVGAESEIDEVGPPERLDQEIACRGGKTRGESDADTVLP